MNRRLMAIGIAAALVGAGAIAAQRWPVATPAAPPVPEPTDQPAGHPIDVWGPAPAAAQDQAEPLPPVVPAPAVETQLEIEDRGDRVALTLRHANRAEVVRRFAELTGTQILGPAPSLAEAPPLTLHWSGSDVGEAWRRILGDEAGHVMACSGRHACRVWLLTSRAGGPAPAS